MLQTRCRPSLHRNPCSKKDVALWNVHSCCIRADMVVPQLWFHRESGLPSTRVISALLFTPFFKFYNPGMSTICRNDQVKKTAQTQNDVRFLTFLLKPVIVPQNSLCSGSSLTARLRWWIGNTVWTYGWRLTFTAWTALVLVFNIISICSWRWYRFVWTWSNSRWQKHQQQMTWGIIMTCLISNPTLQRKSYILQPYWTKKP